MTDSRTRRPARELSGETPRTRRPDPARFSEKPSNPSGDPTESGARAHLGKTEALLHEWRAGHSDAYKQLFFHLYDQLKRLSRQRLRNERADHTWQTVDLAHEAYLKLAQNRKVGFFSRNDFLKAASRVMSRLLIDYARKRGRKAHGHLADLEPEPAAEIHNAATGIRDGQSPGAQNPQEAQTKRMAVARAYNALREQEPALAKLTLQKFFLGMTIEEIADQNDWPVSHVKNEWRRAKEFLRTQI
jgi:RNA polymerase sigma factor (TIGR02999 family)